MDADAGSLPGAREHRARSARDGSWQRLWPGVYADGGDVTPEQRCWAAALASGGTDAVACGRTAARLWGFPLVDDADPATQAQEHRVDEVIAAPHRRTLHYAGRELRRHRFLLRPGDVVRTARGPVTSPLRTLVDCAAPSSIGRTNISIMLHVRHHTSGDILRSAGPKEL